MASSRRQVHVVVPAPGTARPQYGCAGLRNDDEPGFWEMYGYHNDGDPWKEQRYRGD
jgi:DMSO/TMAO reductase YedYZ molybdopterin-dependent catalytic subunit